MLTNNTFIFSFSFSLCIPDLFSFFLSFLWNSVTVTGNQMHSMGPLGITIGHDSLNVWQLVTVELLLTFVVVFTTYATMDSNRKSFGSDALSIGIAYLIASLTGVSIEKKNCRLLKFYSLVFFIYI